jgi:hypothetical protein
VLCIKSIDAPNIAHLPNDRQITNRTKQSLRFSRSDVVREDLLSYGPPPSMSQTRAAHGFGGMYGSPRTRIPTSSTGSTSSQPLSMLLALPLFAWHGGRSVPVTFLTSAPSEKSALSQTAIALSFSAFTPPFGLA